MNQSNRSRRRFLLGTLGLGSAALLELRGQTAEAAGMPHLTPSVTLAKALRYHDNAADVNRTQNPTYKPGDECAKCKFFKGKAGATWGPCQVFKGYDVNRHGWCVSFVKKT